jgi:hypothetical protein
MKDVDGSAVEKPLRHDVLMARSYCVWATEDF